MPRLAVVHPVTLGKAQLQGVENAYVWYKVRAEIHSKKNEGCQSYQPLFIPPPNKKMHFQFKGYVQDLKQDL